MIIFNEIDFKRMTLTRVGDFASASNDNLYYFLILLTMAIIPVSLLIIGLAVNIPGIPWYFSIIPAFLIMFSFMLINSKRGLVRSMNSSFSSIFLSYVVLDSYSYSLLLLFKVFGIDANSTLDTFPAGQVFFTMAIVIGVLVSFFVKLLLGIERLLLEAWLARRLVSKKTTSIVIKRLMLSSSLSVVSLANEFKSSGRRFSMYELLYFKSRGWA